MSRQLTSILASQVSMHLRNEDHVNVKLVFCTKSVVSHSGIYFGLPTSLPNLICNRPENNEMGDNLKKKLWASADKLRAQMDATECKHNVLGLIFLKYISNTFVKYQDKVWHIVSDPLSDKFINENPAEYEVELEERDYYIQDNVFWVP